VQRHRRTPSATTEPASDRSARVEPRTPVVSCVGPILEKTPIGAVGFEKGASALQLSRDLDVQYKTAFRAPA
jgi:hypothetical protein